MIPNLRATECIDTKVSETQHNTILRKYIKIIIVSLNKGVSMIKFVQC